MVRNSRFHRWGNSQRLMNAADASKKHSRGLIFKLAHYHAVPPFVVENNRT
jgi:hypothetical protein